MIIFSPLVVESIYDERAKSRFLLGKPLPGNHVGKLSVFTDEFVIGAFFYDRAIFEHQYAVTVADR